MIPIEDIQKKYGVEMAVVVLACRVHFKAADSIELQDFIDGNTVDWDKVLEICYMHRIRMLVYRVFLTVNIPDTFRQYIKEGSFSLIEHNFKQALELERIVSTLEAEGITVIPYKGLVFSKQFFGDIISRESSDMDLIVKPDEMKKVIPLMKGLGYSFPNETVLEHLGEDYFERYKDFIGGKFIGDECEFTVEFHWKVAESVLLVDPKINDFLYELGSKEKIANREVKTLDTKVHFIFILIHHAIKDVFHSLREISDLAQFAYQKQDPSYWKFIKNKFDEIKLPKALIIANNLTIDLFGVSLGPELNQNSSASNKFLKHILSENYINPHYPFNAYLQARRLDLRDSSLDKMNYLLEVVKDRLRPSDEDIRLFRLPKPLFFLYGIIKPIRTIQAILTKRYQ